MSTRVVVATTLVASTAEVQGNDTATSHCATYSPNLLKKICFNWLDV
ncbi:unnamed protein product, partial [Vitis vinifera]|uniref:Uncharacterized protein n=1 Tax=Vitis vinifera TaxID=29760 RepID=D7TPH9_VITVI